MPKDKVKKAAGAALATAASVSGMASGESEAGTEDDNIVEYDDGYYEFEYGDDEWGYVEQFSSSGGEEKSYSANEDDSTDARQTLGMGVSYDDSRNRGTWWSPQIWEPSSDDHELEVEVFSYPSDSGIRITDPITLQQGESEGLSNVAEATLSYLWDLATAKVGLPVPDPFDFMEDEVSIEEKVRTGSNIVYAFNDDPDVQGIDWLARTDTPTKEGWYMLDGYCELEAGFRIDGSPHAGEETNRQWHACDFEVYR